MNETLKKTFLSCYSVKSFNVEFAKLFDIDWTTFLNLCVMFSLLVSGKGVV